MKIYMLFLSLISGIFLFVWTSNLRGMIKDSRLRYQNKKLKKEISRTKKEIESLSQKLGEMKNDDML